MDNRPQEVAQGRVYRKGSLLPDRKKVCLKAGIASPVLANMTLDGMETELSKHFSPGQGNKVNFVSTPMTSSSQAQRKSYWKGK